MTAPTIIPTITPTSASKTTPIAFIALIAEVPTSLEYPGFDFTITARDPDSEGRCGVLTTPHGSLETPAFIFCATKAALRVATIDQAAAEATQIILANTYHLMLQPGADVVERLGGLHKMTGWQGPMLTDSGGYQVFSMAHGGVSEDIKGKRPRFGTSRLKVTEEGAQFRSYVDGTKFTLTPESAMQVQRQLAPDLVVVLDECTAFKDSRDYTARSMERTHRWANRSLAAFATQHDGRQAVYGVLQGGVYEDLRRESAEYISQLPTFGLAVGGCLGKDPEELAEIANYSMRFLRRDRPIHFLGVGGIADIFAGVGVGMDTFDCVVPTRLARHGGALIKQAPLFRLNLHNACHRGVPEPIDPACPCYTCRTHSRGYLHHLFKADELLGMTLLTLHNIRFMNDLMTSIRTAIRAGQLSALKQEWLG
jgi:queuine tRNA-ribosyltransferase